MSPQDSGRVQVTFSDVAACFSKEEWKLLHDWQKELYNNVMKDIRQAMISLGPLIAASVFSLNTKEKKDLCHLDHQDPERKAGINDYTSHAVVSSQLSICVKEEEEPYSLDHQDIESGKSQTALPIFNTDIPATKEEEELTMNTMDKHATEGRKSRHTTSTALPVVMSVYSLNLNNEVQKDIKKEMEPAIIADAGEMIMLSKRIRRQTANSFEETTYSASRQSITEALDKSKQLLSVPVDEIAEEETTRMKNVFCNTSNSIVSPTNQTANEPETYQIGESGMKNTMFQTCPPNAFMNWKPYACIECDQSFALKGDLHQHQQTHKAERPSVSIHPPSSLNSQKQQNGHEKKYEQLRHTVVRSYVCSVCTKKFSQKGSLKRHQITHTGIRFACSECEKSFTRKEMLTVHKRTHTGEKPFQCPDCGKSFSHRGYLFSHKKQHTGEKPFKCTDCGKNFTNLGNLETHKRTHTGEKPYQCSECEKSFTQKGHLSIHEKTHKSEKPFHCVQCGKSFNQKRHLLVHRATHEKGNSCQTTNQPIDLEC